MAAAARELLRLDGIDQEEHQQQKTHELKFVATVKDLTLSQLIEMMEILSMEMDAVQHAPLKLDLLELADLAQLKIHELKFVATVRDLTLSQLIETMAILSMEMDEVLHVLLKLDLFVMEAQLHQSIFEKKFVVMVSDIIHCQHFVMMEII